MAFLQVITRTFLKRPGLLAEHEKSLAALSDPDWEQTLVVDDAGRGVAWANANLATVPATGEWVWVLDDDDLCVKGDLVETLKRLGAERECGVIVMRATHVAYTILPHDNNWGVRPTLTDCGYSNFFIRGEAWNRHRAKFRELDCYAADHAFYAHVWDQGERFHWHDAIAAHYPVRSIGRPE